MAQRRTLIKTDEHVRFREKSRRGDDRSTSSAFDPKRNSELATTRAKIGSPVAELLAVSGASAIQGSSILPLYLPPERVSANLIADTFGRLWVSCHALIVTVNCHAHHRCAMTDSHGDRPTYCLESASNSSSQPAKTGAWRFLTIK